jgi:hypothetical protein
MTRMLCIIHGIHITLGGYEPRPLKLSCTYMLVKTSPLNKIIEIKEMVNSFTSLLEILQYFLYNDNEIIK